MKKLIIALVYILFAKAALAQQDLLSFDEHNKYIYYQVVDMPGISADTLHGRGLSFLKTYYPKIKIKAIANENGVSGPGKFLVYGGISVLKHEKGEINFVLNIEFKDQKYRYWLTNFIFTPYQRDRYGNFVPQQGIDIPLENALAKFDKKDVDGYLNETGAYCKQFGDKLKQFVINVPKKEEVIKKVVTDKW
jgi:hypothetical protein